MAGVCAECRHPPAPAVRVDGSGSDYEPAARTIGIAEHVGFPRQTA